jgi:pimeloyl-ACP methyl ester carboxylesterase
MTRRLVLSCLILSACIAPQPVFAPLEGDDVTVFVHGYRASFLADESGAIAYVTPGQGLSKGDRSLAFPFEGQRDFPRYGPLHVVGPLTKLTAIPLVYELDPYLSWMTWAKTRMPGFHAFAYDWRRDIRESGQALCQHLEALGPRRRVRILAHSMGGLVTLSCLRSGSDAVRAMVVKVAFVGTPFRGGPGQWDDLQLGTKTGSNEKLLDAETLLTFPSAWQLLGPQPDFFVDSSGAPTSVPAFDADTWLARRWGLFSDEAVRANPAYRVQLEQRLSAHRALWSELSDVEGPPPPVRVLAIIGHGRETLEAWRVTSDGTVSFTNPTRGNGDGTVLAARAVPPKPLVADVVETRAEHSELFNDDGVREVLRAFVNAP